MEARLAEHVHVTGGAATVNIMDWISAVTYVVSCCLTEIDPHNHAAV
jgi:hypothetical protein